MEKPHTTILDREQSLKHASEHFSDEIALLRDFTNYGSNLVIRAYNSSGKGLSDAISCGVLLKQVVAMIDAATILLEAGTAHAAFLPARAAFEASVYLDWVLFSDSERKSKCYYVANLRDERLWALRSMKGTLEAKAFDSISKRLGLDIHTKRPNLAQQAKAQLDEVNRILAQPELQPIDLKFDQVRGKRKTDPEWYELNGAKSIRQISEKIDRLAEYEFFYSRGSQIAHSGTYKDHIRLRNRQLHFKNLRHLEGIGQLLNFLIAAGLSTYDHVLRYYRPEELTAFRTKYINDWRKPFLSIKGVRYNV